MENDKSCKTPRWRMLKSKLNNLSADEFGNKSKLHEDAILIDVRTRSEYLSGHMPSAINIDYLADDFWDRIEALDGEKTYFIYCRSGRRSIRVCTLMRNGGFQKEKIFNLDKGFADWIAQSPDVTMRK